MTYIKWYSFNVIVHVEFFLLRTMCSLLKVKIQPMGAVKTMQAFLSIVVRLYEFSLWRTTLVDNPWGGRGGIFQGYNLLALVVWLWEHLNYFRERAMISKDLNQYLWHKLALQCVSLYLRGAVTKKEKGHLFFYNWKCVQIINDMALSRSS